MSEIRNMRFKFTKRATVDDVFDELEPALRRLKGGKAKVSKHPDYVTVTYDGINYRVELNDDATFSVHWQKSAFDKILTVLAFFADKDGEAEPTGKYNKIRTATPIIAYELQQSFGITADSEERIKPLPEQRAREISEPTKSVAADSNASKNYLKKNDGILDKILRHKIIFVVLIMLAGLTIIVASYGNPTPKTVDQFVKQYNEEIKRTAGAVEKDKYHGHGGLVKSCTLDNVKSGQEGKYQPLFNKSILFSGNDFVHTRDANDRPIEVSFIFYNDSSPVDAVFAIIEATIAAAGDDEEEVAKALGILRGNQYSIPYGYEKSVTFENKGYWLKSFDTYVIFSVIIHLRKN